MELEINRIRHHLHTDAARSLLHVLREDLGLTGSKPGCGEGECGACTVLLGGQPVRACQTPVGEAVGAPVTTIEGLEEDGRLHPLQTAFLEAEAMQCSYCTAGMIMNGVGLLQAHPNPTVPEIVAYMEGNVCRCGVYGRIIKAIRRAAEALTEQPDG